MQETSEQVSHTRVNMPGPVSECALDPEEWSCCICYQPFRHTTSSQDGSEIPLQLPCGHIFGEACILSWTLANNSCPLCRKAVFEIDDQPANKHFSNFHSLDAPVSELTSQGDVWHDEYVWNNSDGSYQDAVSTTDNEILIAFYSCDRPNSSPGSRPQACLERITGTQHRNSCQCSDDKETRCSGLPHWRLTPSEPVETRRIGIDMFDLSALGSQFAELESQYRLWMDEYLNEPCFLSGNSIEDFSSGTTRLNGMAC